MLIRAVLHLIDQLAEAIGREVLVQVVVDQRHGGGAAGSQTLELDERELAIVGGLAHIDAQLGFDCLGARRRFAELAGD